MPWLIRCHPILTASRAMATPQIRTNPETRISTHVTKTRQISRGRYVLQFTSTRQPPMTTRHQRAPGTRHQRAPAAGEAKRRDATPATRREGAVPPPEASTRCLRVASGVIHYMKPNERRCILVDDKSRNLSCFVILLCDCNIV